MGSASSDLYLINTLQADRGGVSTLLPGTVTAPIKTSVTFGDIEVEGPQAKEAIQALVALFEDGFGEED